ncbi:MAG: hypothetical protein ACRD1R_14400 [Acidobacteriota bacterium]
MKESEKEEIKRHFDVVAEQLGSQIQLIAEGQDSLEKRITSLEKRMTREFDEVKAMIKFSYAQLDQRLTTAESDIVDLKVRVAKLEARL